MTVQQILKYRVEGGSVDSVVDQIAARLDRGERKCTWMACLNPHSYAVAKKDNEFREALSKADWLVPDGIGVVIASRILNRPLTQRITGFDIFEGVMDQLDRRGGTVFFLGSTEETLRLISNKLSEDYPGCGLVGTYSPPFKARYNPLDLDQMVEAVAKVRPDVIWVGLTAPKQEKLIADLQDRLDVVFAGAVGAVFDFYIGKVIRSPPIFQKMGLEWLPRLLQQPRRLWRRMFVSAPIFIGDVLAVRWRGTSDD